MIEGRTLAILLIEDETMIRMMVADMVEELGHHVAAEAGNFDEAMALAESAAYDFAIIDMNLNGKMSIPIAEVIKARHIPFIFASGYAFPKVGEQNPPPLALQKPFTIDRLEAAIDETMQARS